MSDPLLTLTGVNTHIGRYHILQGVDLAVERGSMTVLLGRNGAGKTTTLRTIIGLWSASAGNITMNGKRLVGMTPADIARAGIAYVPENMGLFATLTVRENMVLAARNGPIDPERLDWIFNLFPALQKLWDLPAGTLSGGQKQMLAIARAIVEPRELLIVDEPTKGLAPAIVNQLTDTFRELKAMNTSVLMVEQNFNMARSIGDAVFVMDDGRIAFHGTMAALAGDVDLQTRLLGLSLDSHQ